MHPRSQNPSKWLTQALIISGALNIGLIATFAYIVAKDKQQALSMDLATAPQKEAPITNVQLLRSYSLLPYQELLVRLENDDHIEEGMRKRDLALACLAAFHHFDMSKALGGLFLQKRTLAFSNSDGEETIDIPVFPGLADAQFQAILHYAKTEKWPLTSQGLFYEIKRAGLARDPSLLDAFYLSSEFSAVQTLLNKTGLNLKNEEIVDLIAEGEWKPIAELARAALDLTPDRRRGFLLEYLSVHSKMAAKLLLEGDPEFVLRRLDDAQILSLLDLYGEKTPAVQSLAKELLASPRTDAVCKRAAALLYAFVGEALPEPYDHALAMQRFVPAPVVQEAQPLVIQVKAPIQPAVQSPTKSKKKTHTVETGDNLWKIARKYQVSVEEIMRANRMDTEKLRPGKQLEIPDKSEKKK